MEFLASPEAGLFGLFVSSFLAATLLPGGSEAAFFALVSFHPEHAVPALALATIGNTLGGMTTYAMARLLPEKTLPRNCGASPHPSLRSGPPLRGVLRPTGWSAVVTRHGAPILIFAWAPVVGDALCAAAGWLRLPWLACTLWMAAGKGLRYAALLMAMNGPGLPS